MTIMSRIKEHMEVIGADGVHVGTVDRVEENRIKLTKADSGEGRHKALNRHRGKGQQKVTVEHVHVHQGGQAIVGHVEHKREGGQEKKGGSTPCKGD